MGPVGRRGAIDQRHLAVHLLLRWGPARSAAVVAAAAAAAGVQRIAALGCCCCCHPAPHLLPAHSAAAEHLPRRAGAPPGQPAGQRQTGHRTLPHPRSQSLLGWLAAHAPAHTHMRTVRQVRVSCCLLAGRHQVLRLRMTIGCTTSAREKARGRVVAQHAPSAVHLLLPVKPGMTTHRMWQDEAADARVNALCCQPAWSGTSSGQNHTKAYCRTVCMHAKAAMLPTMPYCFSARLYDAAAVTSAPAGIQ
jgi:hypothetical protein